MTAVLFFAWVLAGVVVVGLVALLVRFLLSAVRGPRRKWVERAPGDRRRRQVPVRTDRRRGPRRQEDIARQFLDNVGT